MENNQGVDLLRLRGAYAAMIIDRQALANRMSDVALQQAMSDRRTFEILAETNPTVVAPAVEALPVVTIDEASSVLARYNEALERKYALSNERPKNLLPRGDDFLVELARLMDDVATFRQQFLAEEGVLPQDNRVYRKWHMELQRASPDEPNYRAATDRVVIIRALMDDDITNGHLPF